MMRNVKFEKHLFQEDIMNYGNMSHEELNKILMIEKNKFDEYKSMNLKYDMTRGKPASKQLALSDDMMSDKYIGDYKTSDGLDCRNYGILDGIPEIKKLFVIGKDNMSYSTQHRQFQPHISVIFKFFSAF